MSFSFRPFQTKGIDQVADLAARGVRRIIFQAGTGAGKTVLFSGLVQRFITKYSTTRVIIAVHREELLRQTIKALHNVAKIEAAMIIAGYNTPVRDINGFMVPYNSAQVIVGMVETLHNRFKKYENYLGGTGMLIVDEVHLANFHKLYDHFPKQLIVGFTATPISADKRKPLNLFFDEIVSPVTINELITEGFLAQNITFTVKGTVNRKNLSIKGGDFDENVMARAYSAPKHIENCVQNYTKYCMGEKSIVFNCNIEHSKLINDAFVAAGFNSRHIDGNATPEERKEIRHWFEETDDAILNNVALWTMGIDEPTIQCAIINRATMSLPLWLQMPGRASRAIPDIKTHFKIIDLGANLAYHGDWNEPHNWSMYFHHPEQVGAKKGNGPTKLCVQCEAMIHLSTKICPFCGANNAKEIEYDKAKIELELLTKGIDIDALIKKNQDYTPYRILHLVKNNLIQRFRSKYKHLTCAQNVRDLLNDRYQAYVQEWCRKNEKPYDRYHQTTTKKWLMAELNRHFGQVDQLQNA